MFKLLLVPQIPWLVPQISSEIASTSVKVYKFVIRTLHSVEYNMYDIRRILHESVPEWNSSFGVT